jgi:hypothetical protein
MDSGGARSGVLVIRIWHEGGTGDDQVRARLSTVVDATSDEPFEWVEVGVDAILDTVRTWLEGFARDVVPRP